MSLFKSDRGGIETNAIGFELNPEYGSNQTVAGLKHIIDQLPGHVETMFKSDRGGIET